MIAKFIMLPEWMINRMMKVKQHSGQTQNAIIRIALDKYIKEYEQSNNLSSQP